VKNKEKLNQTHRIQVVQGRIQSVSKIVHRMRVQAVMKIVHLNFNNRWTAATMLIDR